MSLEGGRERGREGGRERGGREGREGGEGGEGVILGSEELEYDSYAANSTHN